MASAPRFNRLAVIGLGLIGGSIARSAHERGLARVIVGCDRNELSMAYGQKNHFLDMAETDPARAVTGSDLVILATPPSTLSAVARAIGPALAPGCLVMDVCSVKEAAIAAIAPHMPEGVDFVPAHPIAGSEKSGIAAASFALFEDRRVIITPEQPPREALLEKVSHFWQGLGARAEAMPPHLHDLIYAYVSHLPQLLAFALPEFPIPPEGIKQKFLRLAASDPALWREIFFLNCDNILRALDRYLDIIAHIEAELASPPPEAHPAPPLSRGQEEIWAENIFFARIAASCLITTVMESEKQTGFSFARYAGSGFTDFTSPAASPAEEDIEKISDHSQAVAALLGNYAENLKKLRSALASGNAGSLAATLARP